MPSKKKKYNARFPAGRIKKIMQTDEEVGKVAQAVPVIISKALEMFIESLLKKSAQITMNRNAKTLTPSHMKQCILSESRFDFLKDLVKNVPDASAQEDQENNLIVEESNFYIKNESDSNSSSNESKDASYYPEQIPSSSSATTTGNRGAISRTPVIQYCPKNNESKIRSGNVAAPAPVNFSVSNILNAPAQPPGSAASVEKRIHNSPLNFQMGAPLLAPVSNNSSTTVPKLAANVPPLVPISRMQPNQSEVVRTSSYYGQSTGDNLCIDEDYDN